MNSVQFGGAGLKRLGNPRGKATQLGLTERLSQGEASAEANCNCTIKYICYRGLYSAQGVYSCSGGGVDMFVAEVGPRTAIRWSL